MSSPAKKVKRDSQVINGLIKDWKWLVRFLGATDSQIEICVKDNHSDVKEQAYRVMQDYIFETYPETSWIDIKKALGILKKNELIESIKKEYQWVRTLDEETPEGADNQWTRTLNEEILEDERHPEFVYSLISYLQNDWKWFVRFFGATDDEVENIVMDNNGNVTEQSYKVMRHIFQKYPKTSWINIRKALGFLQKNELIELIKKKHQWIKELDDGTTEDATYECTNSTDLMLIIVSKHISPNWQKVSKELQLPSNEADQIFRDHKESREQAYQALRLIKRRNTTLQWSDINSALKAINEKSDVRKRIEKELKHYGLIEKSNYPENDVAISSSDFQIYTMDSEDGEEVSLESSTSNEMNVSNRIPEDLKRLLLFAVKDNNTSIVKRYLDHGADVNMTDEKGITLLNYVVGNNYETIVNILVDYGADVNTIDEFGRAALHNAVDEIIVTNLIDHGANVNITDERGRTPLHYAIENSKEKIVDILINRGADVDMATLLGETPLHYAVENNNETIVNILINRGADVNITNVLRQTPLRYAVNRNNESIVKILVDHGADVNIAHKSDKTPLDYAVENNYKNIVKILVDHSADVNDNKGIR